MMYPTRVLGLILIHPTATSAGIQEWFKEKWLNFKLKSSSSNPSAEDYLVMYKFGHVSHNYSVKCGTKSGQSTVTLVTVFINFSPIQISSQESEGREAGREEAIRQYLAELRSRINHKNLQHYMDAFLK